MGKISIAFASVVVSGAKAGLVAGVEYKILKGDIDSFTEANAVCEAAGMVMATIPNRAVTFEVNTMVLDDESLSASWIGANDVKEEGRFVWYNGEPLHYANWDTENNQPDDNQELEDCVVVERGGLWSDVNCVNMPDIKSVVCMSNTVEAVVTDDTQMHYKIVREGATYEDAAADCGNWGGNLTSIMDENANKNVARMLNDGDSAWIGASLDDEGHWTWSLDDSTATDHYNHWEGGAPTEGECGSIFGSATDEWQSADCGDLKSYICKRPRDIVHEYNFTHERMSWSAASDFCDNWGGSLASVKNAEEMAKLVEMIKIDPLEPVWIGATDADEEGKWVW